ncbi:MAG: hypothetical protein MUC34_16380 [Anaerolineae bacterium]|jgi:hypothetical protein|nr:hypothetical protein [Anaerolineae bacterium]
MSISLRIDRLVLDGLPLAPGHAPLVQAAVEAELARLFAERGMGSSWREGGALPAARGAAIQVAPGGSPTQVGAQIAQSIYGGIGGT